MLHGFLIPTQSLVGSFHSNHNQRKRRARANFSVLSMPRPPRSFGRHTASQFTLHFAPVVLSVPSQRKALSSLFMLCRVDVGTMSGVMEKTSCEDNTDFTRAHRPMAVIFCPSHGTSLEAALSTRNWKSRTFSCQTERGSPKYFIGNEARTAGKLWRMVRCLHRIRTTELFRGTYIYERRK